MSAEESRKPSGGGLPNSNNPPIVAVACNVCGALSARDAATCWMCGRDPRLGNPYSKGTVSHNFEAPIQLQPGVEYIQPTTTSRYENLFRVLLGICAVLAILIGIGLAVEDPGVSIGYVILVGPAFLITGVRALLQYSNDGKTNSASLLLSALTTLTVTFAVTIGVTVLLAASAIILGFVLCLEALSRAGH